MPYLETEKNIYKNNYCFAELLINIQYNFDTHFGFVVFLSVTIKST
jgi:hypothetical protein